MCVCVLGLSAPALPPTMASSLAALGLPQMGGGSNIAVPTPCVLLTNMFDALSEKEVGWEEDIRDDVIEEFMRFGDVVHVYVDPLSPDVSLSGAGVGHSGVNRRRNRRDQCVSSSVET